MGRAGGGGGGGHSGGGFSGGGRSGGGHASGGFSGGGRSGGGHASGGFSGGGSRPGSGMGGRPNGRPGGPGGQPGGPGGPGRPPGGPPRRRFWMPFGYGGYGYRGGCSGCFTPVIVIIVIVIILGSTAVTRLGGSVRYALSSLRNTVSGEDNSESNEAGGNNSASGYQSGNNSDNGSTSQSTVAREKADTGVSFSSDCILDELGWVEDAAATGESLEDFYNATGVQPYVYFKAYDASLTSDSEKEAYAFDWYEDNIDNEGTFLFLYFAEEDTDNDVGYMVYVNGYDIDSVMDEEAVDIFWDYVDEYWYSDLSTDDMLTEIFNSTADAIMN